MRDPHLNLPPAGEEVRASTGRLAAFSLVAAVVLLMVVGCGGDGAEQGPATGTALSDTARAGEKLFNANCSACHGVGAVGTSLGPPLMDRVYHPGHHPDFSIRNAVSQGVRQHHWTFGDMAPVAGVSPDEVEKVICYVREMQRAEGIFEGDAFRTVC